MHPSQLLVTLATLVYCVASQSSSSTGEGGYLGVLPPACNTTCQAFSNGADVCSNVTSDAASLACACSTTLLGHFLTCGNCVLAAPGGGPASESGQVVESVALDYARTCNLTVMLDGADPPTSSALSSLNAALPSATAALPAFPSSSTGGAPASIATSTAALISTTMPVALTPSGTTVVKSGAERTRLIGAVGGVIVGLAVLWL